MHVTHCSCCRCHVLFKLVSPPSLCLIYFLNIPRTLSYNPTSQIFRSSSPSISILLGFKSLWAVVNCLNHLQRFISGGRSFSRYYWRLPFSQNLVTIAKPFFQIEIEYSYDVIYLTIFGCRSWCRVYASFLASSTCLRCADLDAMN